MAASYTELTCDTCNQSFIRRTTEYNRNKRLHKHVFCSRKCCGKHPPNCNHIKSRLESRWTKTNNPSGLDEYSPFRHVLKKTRKKSIKSDIDIYYLKELWEKQQGICPYTGWKLMLRNNIMRGPVKPHYASLDRIDSSKGYIRGNVQFVAFIYNVAKNIFSDEDVLNFANSVIVYQNLKESHYES